MAVTRAKDQLIIVDMDDSGTECCEPSLDILKARKEADRMRKMDNISLPEDIDYLNVDNLALEARQKLDKIRPASLGQASRISGINPSDIQVLAIYLKQRQKERSE